MSQIYEYEHEAAAIDDKQSKKGGYVTNRSQNSISPCCRKQVPWANKENGLEKTNTGVLDRRCVCFMETKGLNKNDTTPR
ncbi:hypothetical protein, unlikely [Trypanosoma brucei brucei TREU927]|uniref:Uncharacterized protein n=1 Tax=Trypanosoma brucei brucei (strain 927/4 GUTat10.1) TaxID=185431 RepID=Q38CN3_TRYB2|nr:hypothetical protein, unlikely [Trypanosoma brucei brucei TREU927]EAN77437.1 hypothetical protein, unlikely [Trypanosoma brucei brucei TREU927]